MHAGAGGLQGPVRVTLTVRVRVRVELGSSCSGLQGGQRGCGEALLTLTVKTGREYRVAGVRVRERVHIFSRVLLSSNLRSHRTDILPLAFQAPLAPTRVSSAPPVQNVLDHASTSGYFQTPLVRHPPPSV